MKSALDTAFICVNFFTPLSTKDGETSCKFLYLDEIHFIEPVSIGDIAIFSAKVIFVENNIVHVRVKVEVVRPGSSIKKTTNLFHFVFKVQQIQKQLYPSSYKGNFEFFSPVLDGIYYLDAKRRHEKYLESMNKF
jgi:hypothetical protein